MLQLQFKITQLMNVHKRTVQSDLYIELWRHNPFKTVTICVIAGFNINHTHMASCTPIIQEYS